VKGLQISDCRFSFIADDERPAIALESTSDFELKGIQMSTSANANGSIYLNDANHGLITGNSSYTAAKNFVWQQGNTSNVALINNYHPKIKAGTNLNRKK